MPQTKLKLVAFISTHGVTKAKIEVTAMRVLFPQPKFTLTNIITNTITNLTEPLVQVKPFYVFLVAAFLSDLLLVLTQQDQPGHQVSGDQLLFQLLL